MWARGVQRLVFLVLLLHLGAAQKKETYGGGTKSNFKDFEKEGLEAFTEEMEHMQEWWCVEKNHLGDELCDSYGKVDPLKNEAEIRAAAKRPPFHQLDAMHTAWCDRLSGEERSKNAVCLMWLQHKKGHKATEKKKMRHETEERDEL
mmetsp:Transcript_3344/g.6628  ORF Transcript_3344/g.6628 Transcript_3344/m.6628 type:complete len:147 (-) Transcript_3344:158-598(-)|eukprot:CAMPEP_0171605508 /NCGR_PEP_ID=MMETSP0990-20121206/7232_1 /TAXON_ID=483369 /ORGANISM="non described non described, Strain CCMP2098" /LENGTH=146 /DNA_ID=CAMNT_0012168213 /DNA_START=22 /DNA_END=462 /DNA_ORIENTATION=-